MKISVRFALLSAVLVGVVACGKEDEKADVAATSAAPASAAGGVEQVEVTASGSGPSRDEAIRDAVLRAVEEVHGRAVSMSNVSQELGSVEKSKDVSVMGVGASKSETERTTVGGRRLEESTRGLVTSIRILEEDEGRKGWTVKLVAKVAKFTAPGAGKPTVIVGQPKGDGLGEESSALIRGRISEALTSSGKVAVLDRSNDSELEAELEFAGSNAVTSTEALKQGQAQVADFLVQIVVDEFGVDRNVRTLRMTGREIVQYSGRASATYRLVHVATRQVVASGKASASKASGEALQDNVDVDAWRAEMLDEIAGKLATDVSKALVSANGGTGANGNGAAPAPGADKAR